MTDATDRFAFADGPHGPVHLLLKRANRHGLVTGATGTGKTVTLQRLAEGFSRAGVPVFCADVKGDLAGLCAPKEAGGFAPPATLWDLVGGRGHPVRTTVTEIGPTLLSRLLDLNPTQSGVLAIAFAYADDNGLLLLDLKDLRAVLNDVGDNAKAVGARYGLVSKASIAAIQRGLLGLETGGGARAFGEPALRLPDLMRTDARGFGAVNVLASEALMQQPRLYAAMLLWLLAELFEQLPEAGDLPKPKLVLFFDEAHLLFDDAPPALVDKVEQVVRLIRSKGVAVFFVTQNPLDIPETILGQIGNRIQHALRAFTPRDQKAVRAAAETFRQNAAFDTVEAITTLKVGEALVSTLDASGAPTPVERAQVRLPETRLGPLTDAERAQLIAASPLSGAYDAALDRDSAYEILARRAEAASEPPAPASPPPGPAPRASARRGDTPLEAAAKSAARAAGSQLGRQIMRGVLGALFRGR